MSKQSKPGGAACAFAQTLGADILRQAREMDETGHGCIRFGALVGNREVGRVDRATVKRVYVSRVQKTGLDVAFVVEKGFPPYDMTRLEFVTARAAIACFALTVARIHQEIHSGDAAVKMATVIHVDMVGRDEDYKDEEVWGEAPVAAFAPLKLPPYDTSPDAIAAFSRFVDTMTAHLASPPRCLKLPWELRIKT